MLLSRTDIMFRRIPSISIVSADTYLKDANFIEASRLYNLSIELQKKGVVSLKMKPIKNVPKDPPVLIVTVNNKYKIAYDTLDGFTSP